MITKTDFETAANTIAEKSGVAVAEIRTNDAGDFCATFERRITSEASVSPDSGSDVCVTELRKSAEAVATYK